MLMLYVLNALNTYFPTLQNEEEGQGLVEYALILVLVSIVVIAVLTLLGTQVQTVFNNITAGLGG